MLLKKQTVWLLTMLSLVVVLSVYYVLQDPVSNDLASGKEEAESASNQVNEKDLEIMTQAAGDEVYETVRMDLQDKRSEEKLALQNQLGEKELTADEKNELYTEMEKIDELATKEQIIETNIKGLGYSDALVEIEDNTVNILVKAEEHSKADAVNILKVIKEEISTNYAPNIEFDTK